METIKRWYSNFLRCAVPRRLETLESDRLAETVKAEFPSEIIEDIVSRLPVKSILRFRSVSKPWLSLISNPSFNKLQLTNANVGHRTALFIIANDESTCKQYFLSAAHDGGSVTHHMTIDLSVWFQIGTQAEHLNGLVSYCARIGHFIGKEALIVNPSTRKIFKLPIPTPRVGAQAVCYFFGFDESRDEHKILGIFDDRSSSTVTIQIMIPSLSNYSWKKVDVTSDTGMDSMPYVTSSICVNSIIYLLILGTVENFTRELEILAFDLTTEKFSIVKVPQDAALRVKRYFTWDEFKSGPLYPYLIKINGCIAVVCHDRVVETNQMHIWISQDYENRVWVRETVTFPEAWRVLGCPFPMDSANEDEIIFSLSKLSRNVIRATMYNIKSGCFRWVQFTLNHPFLCSKAVKFNQIKCYVESIVPLPRTRT